MLINIDNDGKFDSGPVAISTATGLQEICRIRNRGRNVLASVIIAGQTIANLAIGQSAYPDDPNPLIAAQGTGLNSVVLANESYVIPALAFPLATGVVQVRTVGGACETIYYADGAGGAGCTVRVVGTVSMLPFA